MKLTADNDEPVAEITETDREELGRQIAQGVTSGRLDDGTGKHITWSLTAEVWTD